MPCVPALRNSVHANWHTNTHKHTQAMSPSLCWSLQQPLSRVKPFAACWPETYMSVRETGKGAKLKMIVSWWAVSGVLDLGWPSHYKSLMLLSTTTVATPSADPAPLRSRTQVKNNEYFYSTQKMKNKTLIHRQIFSIDPGVFYSK